MAECKICGYQLSDKDTVCPMCGAAAEKQPVPQPAQQPVSRCPFCAAEADASANFCPSCGKSLAVSGTTTKPLAPEEKKRIEKGVDSLFYWVIGIAVVVGLVMGWLGL